MRNLRQRLTDLQDTYAAQRRDLEHQLARYTLDLRCRRRLGKTTTRAWQRVDRLRREMTVHAQRLLRQQRSLLRQLYHHETKACQLHQRLTWRTVPPRHD